MRNNIESTDLTFLQKIISKVLKKYTYKIYRQGVVTGYNWAKNDKYYNK